MFAESDTYLGSINTATVTSSGTYATGVGTSLPLLSMPRILAAIDRTNGRQLMAVSCERRMSASYTAGVLVNRLRKQIEKQTARPFYEKRTKNLRLVQDQRIRPGSMLTPTPSERFFRVLSALRIARMRRTARG